MENASKALIIAGAILLSILIIAIGMYIFNSSSNSGKSNFGGDSSYSSMNPPKSVRSAGNGLDMLNNNPFIKKGFSNLSSLNSNTFDKPKAPAVINYKVGDSVSHAKFGDGKVTEMVPKDNDYMVTVEFNEFGTKKMKASFARLVKN